MSGDGGARAPLLRAFVWLRWRALVNSLSRRRRSGWQRVGAVAEVAGKVLLWSTAGGGALVLAGVAGFLPLMLARGAGPGEGADPIVLFVLRLLLLLLLLVLLIVPAFQGLARGALGRTRLLLLPIRESTLHAVEVGAHLGDPWLLMFVPAFGAIALGTVAASAPGALVMLVAGALLVLALVALSATASFGVELALRDRRRAEALGLVVMLVWLGAVMLPGLQQSRRREHDRAQSAARVEEGPGAAGAPAGEPRTPRERWEARQEREAQQRAERERRHEALARYTPFVPALQALPSEAYARSLALCVAGRPAAALPSLGALALTSLGLLALSRTLWRRLQASPPGSGGRVGSRELPRPPRLPGLGAAASTVAWGQVRGLLRTLIGRLNLAMGPVVALVLIFMVRSDMAHVALGERALGTAWTGVALAVGGLALAGLSQQSFSLNQFGIDGTGFSLEVLAPLRRRDLVLGKWAATAILSLVVVLLITGLVMSLEPAALPFWPAILLATAGTQAVLAPVASWISMLLPKAVDLGRLGRDAQPNQTAALVGMVVTPLALVPPLVLGAAVYLATGSVLALTAAEAAWTAAGLLVARLLLAPVAATLTRREEAIHLALLERG